MTTKAEPRAAKAAGSRLEADLFEPIREHLQRQGFTVRAEVEHCDIVAYSEGRLIVVELKRRFGVDVLIQAVARQRITQDVYIGLPRSALRTRRKQRRVQRLLRRLELGLILVDLSRVPATAHTPIEPAPFRHQISSRLRARVLEEMIGRSAVHNRGGVPATKLMTAYRENALQIACCLARLGPLTPRTLRELGCGSKSASILQRNVYGWYRRVSRGVYELTSSGLRAIEEHAGIAARYLDALEAQSPIHEANAGTAGVQRPSRTG